MNNFRKFSTLNNTQLENNPFVSQNTARETVLRVTEPEKPAGFKEIFDIEDPQQMAQAINLANVFTQVLNAVDENDEDTFYFDVTDALEAIKNLEPKAALIEYIDETISQEKKEVSAILDPLIALLKSLIQGDIDARILDKIKGAVTGTFTNVEAENNNSWIFYSETTAYQVAYVYNLFFAFPNQFNTAIICMPITMTIEAQSYEEKYLFVTTSSKVTYKVRVQALTVIQSVVDTSNTALDVLSELT
ncbi:TPA: hypothetical protein RMI67_005525 [Bacillus cereus]|nr:hypothetical protein [Bacillus cereus]